MAIRTTPSWSLASSRTAFPNMDSNAHRLSLLTMTTTATSSPTTPATTRTSRGGGTPISRRDALRTGLCGAAGVVLADRLGQPALAAAKPAKAKAVIQIWLWGGPPHTDTFDPKPDSGEDYTGPLNETIPTNVDGIRVNAALPLLAQQADKYSIIRSMTHGNNGHETAA